MFTLAYDEKEFEGQPDDLVPSYVLAGRTTNRCIDFFVTKYGDESQLNRSKPEILWGTPNLGAAGGYSPNLNIILWSMITSPHNRATAGEEVGHWLYRASNPDPRISGFELKRQYTPEELKIANLQELMGRYAALIYTAGTDEVLETITEDTPEDHAQGYRGAQIIWDTHGDQKFRELLFMPLEKALALIDSIAP
jgi:hypothetical protein